MSKFWQGSISMPLLLIMTVFTAAESLAAEITSIEAFQQMPIAYPKFMIDNLWILMAAALVFVMHLGFATLESGLTRQKNTANILFKNMFVIPLMYPLSLV